MPKQARTHISVQQVRCRMYAAGQIIVQPESAAAVVILCMRSSCMRLANWTQTSTVVTVELSL